MKPTPSPATASPSPVVVVLSLLAVYVIWGSTYLGIKLGLDGFPPFLLNGFRFLIAGGLLLGYLLVRPRPSPGSRRLWNAAKVGVVMLVGGVGLVTLAEQAGVGSGLAATAVAVIPVWTAMIGGLLGDWPRRREWTGLTLGLAGVLVLAGEGDFQASPKGMVLIVIAPIVWSMGSVWATRLELPDTLTSTTTQLLAAGVTMTAWGLVAGERIIGSPSAAAWAAMLYLAVMGSLVAFTAFIYLLENVRPSLATSYAYVNPVVAVLLGVTLGGETITGPVLIALPLILIGVLLVAGSRDRRSEPARLPEPSSPITSGEAA